MTTLTMRFQRGHFAVTGPDIEMHKFKTRREAKDWCAAHYPSSPIKEIGADAVKRATKGEGSTEGEMMVRVVMFSAIFLAAANVPAAAETRDDGGAIGHWTRCQFVLGVDAEPRSESSDPRSVHAMGCGLRVRLELEY